MAFTIYRSQDPNAPVLTGMSGSLLAILSGSLVTGYGSQVAAGWTMPFTSSDGFSAAFRNSISGSGMYLSVEDDGIATTKEARIRGFETASSAVTGSGQFPRSGSQGIGNIGGYLIARKSTSADTVMRNWIVVADAYTFYCFIQTGDAYNTYQAFSFGDIYSLSGSGDIWRCLIIGGDLENQGTGGSSGVALTSVVNAFTPGSTTVCTHYMPRSYTGTGTSITAGKHGDYNKGGGSATLGNSGMQTPNYVDNSLYVSPLWVHEPSTSTIRGRMRGLWHLCHFSTTFVDGETFLGGECINNLVGKSFMIIKPGEESSGTSLHLIETSNTLETN